MMKAMVDLHCHILPGLDDGPSQMQESVAMAESAIADGITHVVATPHASHDFSFDYQRTRELCDQLQEKIGSRLKLATGCDFHMSPENLLALRKDPAPYCINQREYLLVEFNEVSIPPSMDQTLHELQLAGLRPIITHPERNSLVRSRPEQLKSWIRQGCFAQVTAGALTGGFGTSAQAAAIEWIGEGLIHFVSSDAHSTRRRVLRLGPAHSAVLDKFGQETAKALFLENPLAALEGRELPHIPEVSDRATKPRRKRFFFF
jgi:protein-tyrosine phosphatase